MNLTDHRPHTRPWAGGNGGGNTGKNTMSQHLIHSLRIIIYVTLVLILLNPRNTQLTCRSPSLEVDNNPRLPKSGFMLLV